MADQKTYDYIICGGGTSGCVVAGRLAEDPSVSVLIIEAGDHSDNVPHTQSAGGIMAMLGSEHDWGLSDEGNAGMGGRKVALARGKVLGGSSAMNGTYAVRGPKLDYDDWKLPGWSGDEVYKYMKKVETFIGDDKTDIAIDSHGYSGPLLTERHPILPIDERVYKSYADKGIPWTEDPFTTGEHPHSTGPVICTVSGGYRSTAAYWVTKDRVRKNVEILTKTTVDKINFTKDLTAESVSVILPDKSTATYSARHEIILSGGAYCTPPILLRSGIGPKSELNKHNIPVVVDSPGVGKNLQDHLLVYIPYELSEPGLTIDQQMWPEGALEKSAIQWATDKTGPMRDFMFNCLAYLRLDDRLADSELWNNAPRKPGRDPMGLDPKKQPNMEMVSVECFMANHDSELFAPPVDGSSVLTMLAMFFGAQSHGSVTLRSTDPNDKPVIQNNYLASDLDTLVLAEGCRFANEIVMTGAGTRDIIKGSWPRGRDHHTWTDRERWIEFVKRNAVTSYHPCATAKMGRDGDVNAVLDAELRVRGVKGLRVADMSAAPTNVQAHTQMIAYAIGEKAADLIKAARGKSGE